MSTQPSKPRYNPPPSTTNNTPTVDPNIHSLSDLLNVSTINLLPPVVKLWVNAGDGTNQVWVLEANGAGHQPSDFNATTNIKSWYVAPPSVAGLAAIAGVSAGTQVATSGSVQFANSNGVSFGLSGNPITASALGGGGVALSAGTNSTSTGTV